MRASFDAVSGRVSMDHAHRLWCAGVGLSAVMVAGQIMGVWPATFDLALLAGWSILVFNIGVREEDL